MRDGHPDAEGAKVSQRPQKDIQNMTGFFLRPLRHFGFLSASGHPNPESER